MLIVVFYLVINFLFISCPYPPTGDEVQAGSVLLPASRRGRYLANIVRRQAVDGTGIKFNKEADRMNAEAKKKVDVLSEELLPYIIAEQERRTTLYKRIMTAIQNGEKGVTIAEIRNKPPLIIRKGLMYRCPENRPPKEPDGSGLIMCEGDNDPSPVLFDSCLSAEDKDLYVAENKYFFCNRHKIEGPDLPHNGSTVIGCAPIERTSLNYTTNKCALEDTDDVVVHYRYYPDRTYKFVTELDPDREVCDHWNPCQIGYIFSLPSPDKAVAASELWRDYKEKNQEYERDEFVPAIPEDSPEECVPHGVGLYYETSKRKLGIPLDHYYAGVLFERAGQLGREEVPSMHIQYQLSKDKKWIYIRLKFNPLTKKHAGAYYAYFKQRGRGKGQLKLIVKLIPTKIKVKPIVIEVVPGQRVNSTLFMYHCYQCNLKGVLVRGDEGYRLHNVDTYKYRLKGSIDGEKKYLEIDIDTNRHDAFGDYFLLIQNNEGKEERIKALTVKAASSDTRNVLKADRLKTSAKVGEQYSRTIPYHCDDCTVTDVLCNGDSVLTEGRVTLIPTSKLISLNIPTFEDSNSCVYMGVFKKGDDMYRKVVAVIENDSPLVTIESPPTISSPTEGEQFEQEISFTCAEDCSVDKVLVNGISLEAMTRRSSSNPYAFYTTTSNSIIIRITEYVNTYEGVYQAVFMTGNEQVTKTIMDVKGGSSSDSPTESTSDTSESTDATDDSSAMDATNASDTAVTTETTVATNDTTVTPAAVDTTASTDSDNSTISSSSTVAGGNVSTIAAGK